MSAATDAPLLTGVLGTVRKERAPRTEEEIAASKAASKEKRLAAKAAAEEAKAAAKAAREAAELAKITEKIRQNLMEHQGDNEKKVARRMRKLKITKQKVEQPVWGGFIEPTVNRHSTQVVWDRLVGCEGEADQLLDATGEVIGIQDGPTFLDISDVPRPEWA